MARPAKPRSTAHGGQGQLRIIAGEWRSLPVAGVFEIVDGRITLWRDYFDRATLMELMGAGGN